MPKRTKNYDSWLSENLTDPDIAANYINAAIHDSREMFLTAMRNVAAAHGISKVAKQARINREGLYRTLSREGNPTLSTLISVLNVFGLEFTVEKQQPRKRVRHDRKQVTSA